MKEKVNLFSCSFTEQPDFSYCISYWNARMKDKGIKVVLLQKKRTLGTVLCVSRIAAATGFTKTGCRLFFRIIWLSVSGGR